MFVFWFLCLVSFFMKFRNVIIIVFILLLTAGGIYYYYKSDSQVFSPPRIKLLPDLALKNMEGQEVRLSEFKGKPLVVNVWASWCPFCRKELEDFSELGKNAEDKFMIIAVNRREDPEIVKSLANQTASGTIIFLLDEKDEFYKSINGFSMPETLFVDREGIVKLHRRGAISLEEMKRRVLEFFKIFWLAGVFI